MICFLICLVMRYGHAFIPYLEFKGVSVVSTVADQSILKKHKAWVKYHTCFQRVFGIC